VITYFIPNNMNFDPIISFIHLNFKNSSWIISHPRRVHVIAFGHNAYMEFIQSRGIDPSFKNNFILRHIWLGAMFLPLKVISFG
jgi:hypothetical protein